MFLREIIVVYCNDYTKYTVHCVGCGDYLMLKQVVIQLPFPLNN